MTTEERIRRCILLDKMKKRPATASRMGLIDRSRFTRARSKHVAR